MDLRKASTPKIKANQNAYTLADSNPFYFEFLKLNLFWAKNELCKHSTFVILQKLNRIEDQTIYAIFQPFSYILWKKQFFDS